MLFELQLWGMFFLKKVPGRIGCKIRNLFIPYKNGINVQIWDNVQIDRPKRLSIGSNVSINRSCVINAEGTIDIGNDVLIGPMCIIYSQNHRFSKKDELIRSQGFKKDKTVIGNNVWIASGVTILPGVNIGDDVVIGAASVITKDIPSNSLIVGNPGKRIRPLYA